MTGGLAAALFLPATAAAHEVYVLAPSVAKDAIAHSAFSEWQVLLQNLDQFMLWAFIGALVVFIIFFVSLSRALERLIDPLLAKLPPFAPFIGRLTISLSFIAAAYYGALCGPELPLQATFGPASPFIRALLVVIGLMLLFGWRVRLAALTGLALFGYEIAAHGMYMLTYANYFGELILLLILGAHLLGFHSKTHDEVRLPRQLLKLIRTLTPYAFTILRVCFGISLLYASLYGKVVHNNLALTVAMSYPDVVHFFGFEPHFLVLGAAIIEILIAVFFILGIEIRFTSLFLLFWLSLSLWYFGEVVWPHLILVGIPLAFICYGYDRYSLEGRFFKRGKRQPVL